MPSDLFFRVSEILRDFGGRGVTESDMTKTLTVLFGVGVVLATANVRADDTPTCCAHKKVALSPRAQANQIQMVSGSTENLVAGRELGSGAKAKASGENSFVAAKTSAKDTDFARGRNALGVAAKQKASGRAGDAEIQLAPLK